MVVYLFHVIHSIVILNMHPSEHLLSHSNMSLPVSYIQNPEMMVMLIVSPFSLGHDEPVLVFFVPSNLSVPVYMVTVNPVLSVSNMDNPFLMVNIGNVSIFSEEMEESDDKSVLMVRKVLVFLEEGKELSIHMPMIVSNADVFMP